ncbi:hypothetical protein Pyn_15917 [Prunus yedoensis var. nudiflora]|uniref:Uncharacterized protein n=1 Tax=Prunus yedoensis var. nudiflora TaxID=2094558 RepID=A0A314ZTL9_PRUYE|nr:hypothetical protein Pyn_15917 [Prunus yedoensis var. nudiflora]
MDAKSDTKLACCRAMCLGMRVPKVSLGKGVPKVGLGSTKLACCKKRWLGTMVPKANGCQIHKACMLQGNVFRHKGAKGVKLACRKKKGAEGSQWGSRLSKEAVRA